MENVRVAFKVLPDGKPVPIGQQFVQCHMVFNVNMENFRRKSRLVAGDHMTMALATITYASAVSRTTVIIALMFAALNDLEVKSGNILNAYVQAPVMEKVWTMLGLEFSKNAGRSAVIIRDSYGLKLTVAAFQSHLAMCMESMGYESCKPDPDIWLRPEIRPEDGVKYYSYLCVILMTFYVSITM